MTMQPMYPAVVNSPGTELAADITSSATEITILSTTGLPSAPNLLTIGSDETAETVRYTKIDGTKLTVERAFQGVAKSWSTGTRVARYFTAYDHDAARENIADLYEGKRKDVSLAPGVQVVESDEGSAFRFGEIRGKTEIRDGVGIINVTNPYAIATSGNLLPPFTEWVESAQLAMPVSNAYEIKLNKTSTNEFATKTISTSLPPNTTFTFCAEVDASFSKSGVYGTYLNVSSIDSIGTKKEIELKTTSYRNSSGAFSIFSDFTVPSDSQIIRVLVGVDAQSTGIFTFKNPMLVPGDKPQPFTPQSRSMWAAECQLASNPLDGSNADVLYVGDDGLPYVLENWRKVALDGSYTAYTSARSTGYVEIVVEQAASAIPNSNPAYLTKYNGNQLTRLEAAKTAPDLFGIHSGNGLIYITISNADSGWGDSYTPTADEIKAYFLGWKMCDGVLATNPYNGTGDKYWVRIVGMDNITGANATPSATYDKFTPYRLQYLKAKPTVKPVKNYETGLTLSKGWNMVEVGSGVVLREKATPISDGVKMNINNWSTSYESSRTKYRVGRYIGVYKNQVFDTWEYFDTSTDKGYGGLIAQKNLSEYDPTAVYHVTYTMLDPTLSATISGSIAANLRGMVTDIVQWASDADRRLSVVETQKAEKDAPQMIKPTPLNGWTLNGGRSSYYKDGSRVYVELSLFGDNAIKNRDTIITKLPYPLANELSRDVIGATFDTANDIQTIGFILETDGTIRIGSSNQGMAKNYISTQFSYLTKD